LNLANEYGDLVYQLIVDELDPEKACIFIESCNGTSTIRGRVTVSTNQYQEPFNEVMEKLRDATVGVVVIR